VIPVCSEQSVRSDHIERATDQALAHTLRRETIRFFWMTLAGVSALHSMLFLALYFTR